MLVSTDLIKLLNNEQFSDMLENKFWKLKRKNKFVNLFYHFFLKVQEENFREIKN